MQRYFSGLAMAAVTVYGALTENKALSTLIFVFILFWWLLDLVHFTIYILKNKQLVEGELSENSGNNQRESLFAFKYELAQRLPSLSEKIFFEKIGEPLVRYIVGQIKQDLKKKHPENYNRIGEINIKFRNSPKLQFALIHFLGASQAREPEYAVFARHPKTGHTDLFFLEYCNADLNEANIRTLATIHFTSDGIKRANLGLMDTNDPVILGSR